MQSENARTHNTRHNSTEKSESIIAPMVPHKGRIYTSPLWTGRRDHPLVRHSLPATVTAARTNECSLHFAHPREAHAPQSHHLTLPLAADSYLRASRECVPPRRQTGKRISESIKVADSIIRRAWPRWHQPLAIGVDYLSSCESNVYCFRTYRENFFFCKKKKILIF